MKKLECRPLQEQILDLIKELALLNKRVMALEEQDGPLRTGPQYPCISRGELLDIASRAKEIGEELDYCHGSAEALLLWADLAGAINRILAFEPLEHLVNGTEALEHG